MKKRIVFLLLCSVLLLSLTAGVFAESPQTTGSLRVRILETGTNQGIGNATVYVYRVANVENDHYALTAAFSDSAFDTVNFGELTASAIAAEAARLASFVSAQQLSYTYAKRTNSSGIVNFNPVELGLYLVVEASPADHTSIAPFLITVPQVINNEYVYAVDAAPKTGTATLITQPTTAPTTRPTTPPGNLPQTGQLWWPVYVFAGAGMACFLLGWVRRKRGVNE